MKNRSGEKIKLASIDELLGVVNEESAMEIEISKIHPFKNHPFKVLDDEKMQDLVESVRINSLPTTPLSHKRVMGIEPTYPAWKAGVLPLNYTRTFVLVRHNET